MHNAGIKATPLKAWHNSNKIKDINNENSKYFKKLKKN